MKCDEIRGLMPDLASGSTVASPEMNEHLHSCADCAGKLEEFRQTMSLLDDWKSPEPSQYFDVRLKARLREEMNQQPASWLHWIRKPALALSLVTVIAVSITLYRGPKAPLATPGTAVGDLQALDKNQDLYADFDVLDDLQVQHNVDANQ